jgi:Ion channel regulatory protein UNC-93
LNFNCSAFIASFLTPKTWLLYVASAVVGAGAAVIWTGQGSYLILNSDSETISRNSGVFWAMLQCRFVLLCSHHHTIKINLYA